MMKKRNVLKCGYPIISIFDQIVNWSGILRHYCILGGMCLCFILVMINVFRLKNNKVKADCRQTRCWDHPREYPKVCVNLQTDVR